MDLREEVEALMGSRPRDVDEDPACTSRKSYAEIKEAVIVLAEEAVKEERAKWLEALIQLRVSSRMHDHNNLDAIEIRVSDNGKPEALFEGMRDSLDKRHAQASELDKKCIEESKRRYEENLQAILKEMRESKCSHGKGYGDYCGHCEQMMDGDAG